jgi:predicted nucleotidyltransferase
VNAQPRIPIDRQRVAEFCRKWGISEFALFGSVLRDDFRPDSDVDVLVRFAPDARWGLLDICRMEDELCAMFGRGIDLVTRDAVEQSENYIRRRAVLSSLEVIHAAG